MPAVSPIGVRFLDAQTEARAPDESVFAQPPGINAPKGPAGRGFGEPSAMGAPMPNLIPDEFREAPVVDVPELGQPEVQLASAPTVPKPKIRFLDTPAEASAPKPKLRFLDAAPVAAPIAAPVAAPAVTADEPEAPADDASQFTKGLQTGVSGAKQMAAAASTIPLGGAAKTLGAELEVYDRIDRGEPVEQRGMDQVTSRARMYAAASPEQRQQLRENAKRNLLGNAEVRSAVVEAWKRYGDEVKASQGRTPNFTDIRDVSSFGDWAAYNIGQGIPYLGASALSAILGGVVGGPAGAAAGAVGSGYAMGVGDIQSELMEKGIHDRGDIALAGGVPYAALDMLGPVGRSIRLISKPTLEAVAHGYFRRAAREIPANAVEEFLNEAGQEIVKDYAVATQTGEPVLTEENLLKWFNSGMAGAATGAPAGAATAGLPQGAAPAGKVRFLDEPQPAAQDAPAGAVPAETVIGAEAQPQPEEPARPNTKPDLKAILDDERPLEEIKAEREAAANWQPTADWQDVPTGAVLPPGVQVEMNMETGQQRARMAPEVGSPEAPVEIIAPEDTVAGAERTAEPTPAQAEAGNYKKRHVKWQGIDIAIETEAGQTRSGIAPDGSPWSVEMPTPYGYIKRTTGKDGDQVDVYLGPQPDARQVFVVDQIDPRTGKFDEHKIMAGFPDAGSAVAAYDAAFSDRSGGARLGAITPMSVGAFKTWLAKGDTTKAIRYRPPTKAETAAVRGAQRSEAARKAVATRRAQHGPLDIFQFIAASGGIASGDANISDVHAVLGRKQHLVPLFGALIRKDGRSLDEIRAALEEAGYLGRGGDDYQTTDLSDLLEALDRQHRGNPVYSAADASQAQETQRRRGDEQEFERQAEALAGVVSLAKEHGLTLTVDEAVEAAAAIRQGVDELDAIANAAERAGFAYADEIADTPREVPDEDFNVPGRDHRQGPRQDGAAPADNGRPETGPDQRAAQGSAPARDEPRSGDQAQGQPQAQVTRDVAGVQVTFPDQDHAEFYELGRLALRGGTVKGRPLAQLVKAWGATSPDALLDDAARYADAILETAKRGNPYAAEKLLRSEDYDHVGVVEVPGRPAQPLQSKPRVFEPSPLQPKPKGLAQSDEAPPERPQIHDLTTEFQRFVGDGPRTRLDFAQRTAGFLVFRGRQTGHESIVAWDAATGEVAQIATQNSNHFVAFDERTMKAARDPARGIVVQHNHPSSRSLSSNDVIMLALPGLRWVVAHGHNPGRDWAGASLNPDARRAIQERVRNTDPESVGQFIKHAYRTVGDVVREVFGDAFHAGRGITPDLATQYHNHAVNRALAAAGLITYLSSYRVPQTVARTVEDAVREGRQAALRFTAMNGVNLEPSDVHDRHAAPHGLDAGMAVILGGDAQAAAGKPAGEGRRGGGGEDPGGASDSTAGQDRLEVDERAAERERLQRRTEGRSRTEAPQVEPLDKPAILPGTKQGRLLEERPKVDRTQAGPQNVIPGAERITDKELAERRMAGPARAKVAQKPADEGLFDVGGRAQGRLLEDAPEYSVPPSTPPAQAGMLTALTRGQPIDRAIRLPFALFGGLDAKGEWKPGQKLSDKAGRILTEAKFSDHGRFAFMNPLFETVRRGLIDRYGLPAEYQDRDRGRALDERRVMLQGAEVMKTLRDAKVGPEEAKVLQAILNGERVAASDMDKLAEPIRRAIDDLGQEAVNLGLVSPESYERNRGSYVHRVYLRHEAEQDALGRWVSKFQGNRRKKLMGDELKGRGMFNKVPLFTLLRHSRKAQELRARDGQLRAMDRRREELERRREIVAARIEERTAETGAHLDRRIDTAEAATVKRMAGEQRVTKPTGFQRGQTREQAASLNRLRNRGEQARRMLDRIDGQLFQLGEKTAEVEARIAEAGGLTVERGQKFVILDKVGLVKGEPRVVQRVYLPADEAIPEAYQGFENKGTWEVRGVGKGAQVTIWRDFTKPEREQMGEVLDARYTIAKTFMLMAHDLATGRFYKDLAANPEWATKQEPTERWVDAAEYHRTNPVGFPVVRDQEVEWVRVPGTDIPNTGGKKKWGALAGMYVRAEIWRDLNELDQMSRPSFWTRLMTQWKLNKTARSPVVHMNNVMSNLMFMDMADIRLQDLVAGVRAYARGTADYQEAADHGALGADQVSQEFRQNTLEPILEELSGQVRGQARGGLMGRIGVLGRIASAIWGKAKAADQKMIDLYRMEDDVFRMAAYMRRRALGDSAKEAADFARQQFLDYDIRAPWVNWARRTVLPFIAYTYRAVPVIAHSIATRPWKLAKYFAVAYALNSLAYLLAPGDEDDERRVMADQEKGRTWLGVPRMLRMPWRDRDGNPVFLDIRRWIPAGDVFDFSQGSSAIGVPAWLQFGGPLMLAFEYVLNKKAFDGKPIANLLTDTLWERTRKTSDWLYKSWMPSAPWVPNSWYSTRISEAARGVRDAAGKPQSLPQAVASSVGIKVKSHDIETARKFRAIGFDKEARELRSLRSTLRRDLERQRLSPDEFKAQNDGISKKFVELARRRRETLGPRPDQPTQ